MKKFNTVDEIRDQFIKEGWSKDTEFIELTLEKAKEKGLSWAVDDITKGEKYFVMNETNNIFDNKGECVFFDIPCVRQEVDMKELKENAGSNYSKDDLINYSNEFYSIKNSNDILWLMVDEDPAEENINGGYEYRVIKSDEISVDDYLDNVEYESRESILWNIIEEKTTDEGYIECDENGNAYLSQIEGIEIDSYLCAIDSSYPLEGYIMALYKNGEEELSNAFNSILSGETDRSRTGEER